MCLFYSTRAPIKPSHLVWWGWISALFMLFYIDACNKCGLPNTWTWFIHCNRSSFGISLGRVTLYVAIYTYVIFIIFTHVLNVSTQSNAIASGISQNQMAELDTQRCQRDIHLSLFDIGHVASCCLSTIPQLNLVLN